MDFHHMLKEIMPPILFRALLRKRASEQPSAAKHRQVRPTFPTYEAALATCQGYGYEEDTLVKVVLAKTQILRQQLLREPSLAWSGQTAQLLLGLSLALWHQQKTQPGRALNVIDVGGACGAHYFTVRSFLTPEVAFRWHVVETPAMALAGRALANDELHFSSDLATALRACDPVDIVHSSGTIQCVPQPRAFLTNLVNSNAEFLLLSRLGVTTGLQDVICVHESRLSDNGPGPLPSGFQDGACRYPFTFMPLADFDAIVDRKYRTIFRFDDSSGIFPVNDEPLVGFGCLVQRMDRSG